MTLHEALASGRRFRRDNGPWREAIVPSACNNNHPPNDVCCKFMLMPRYSTEPQRQCLRLDAYEATDWELERSEDDFESEAESILKGLGLKIEKEEKVS